MSQAAIQQAMQAALGHHRAGRLADAEAIFRQILLQQPDHAEASHLLGVIAGQKGRHDLAAQLIRQALDAAPDRPDYLCNLGIALQTQGKLDEAILCFQRALKFKPDFPQAAFHLANAWRDKGQFDRAVACYKRALRTAPQVLVIHSCLGDTLRNLGHLDQAIACFRQGLAIQPDSPEVHNNLGIALKEKGLLDQAIAAYERAIALKPDFPEAYCNLANARMESGQIEQSIACFQRALELDPRHAAAYDNLLTLHYQSSFDPQTLWEEHQAWNRRHAATLAQFIQPHRNESSPDRRLKIGYVSPDFHEHSVAYFLQSLLAHHDAGPFEVFCYADLQRADAVTVRLREHARHWREITRQSDEQVAEQVRADGIDILVDLAGHTAGNRLLVFARKPAPVQVTYLGYPDTTGLETIDYRLTDALADPPGSESYCSENLVRLPRCFLCFWPPESAPEASALPGLSRRHITFGCFNALPKINPQVIASWSRVLQAVPDSRMLIKTFGLSETSTRDRLLASFAAHGIRPDRLDLRGHIVSRHGHLELHQHIDIALDTFPYNGATTTCEAMWMGVPVLTLAGQSHVSRVGLTLLTNLGLPELAARTPLEYVDIARELAGDLPRLAMLRSTLRDRMRQSPLMDGRGFARDVEAAYRQMWRKWCQTR